MKFSPLYVVSPCAELTWNKYSVPSEGQTAVEDYLVYWSYLYVCSIEYLWLELSHESRRMQLLTSRRLHSLHVHRPWNLTSVFLVVVCPIIPGCSFSGSSSLCKLTSHTLSCIPTSRCGGCCCPDPEICGGKTTQSGLLYRLNWMFCVSLLWSVIVKGCVVIIVSIVQHAAVHAQRCLWSL